jgi:hypothetical protein
MFGFRHGRRGRQGGRGNRQFGGPTNPQRGSCWTTFQQTGEWPVWSRRAGGPGYWRREAAQTMAPPQPITPPEPPQNQ